MGRALGASHFVWSSSSKYTTKDASPECQLSIMLLRYTVGYANEAMLRRDSMRYENISQRFRYSSEAQEEFRLSELSTSSSNSRRVWQSVTLHQLSNRTHSSGTLT